MCAGLRAQETGAAGLKLKITIDGKAYDVEVEVADDNPGFAPPPPASFVAPTALPTSIPMPLPGTPGGSVNEDKLCRSPIAGAVVRINAKTGQSLQVNDLLLVLEAMKMETNITSPVAGTVKAINAKVGESVSVGQVLVEFD
jgi:methylmalonyl-CoA carboxyltransferase small subunit